MLRVQAERIVSALERDRPTFEPMGREELVVSAAYNQQDVEVVLTELGEAAVAFAERCAGLDADDWQRTGVYTWPAEAERTLAWLVRHTLHEGRHHLDDVAEVVARVSG